MKLKYTRAMVTAALEGALEKGEFVEDPIFKVAVPTSCPNVPDEFLNQRAMWKDSAEYEATARDLAARFEKNFKKYSNMPENIVNAGPKA
jgi:phosphoenolpyruvate carboxykinase (ATP)